MGSLFSISNDLNSIFYEIEEAGGEITPEIEAKLALTQDNFRDKCKSYVEAIKSLNSDIDDCKDEIGRVKAFSESKKKNKERLSNALIDAIIAFGDTNKNGNKFVDLTTCKAQIRESEAVELNESLIQAVIESFFNYCKWMYDNNQLGNHNLDVVDVITAINEHIKDNPETSYLLIIGKDEEDKPIYGSITLDDFNAIKVNLQTSCNLSDLLKISFASVVQGNIDTDWLSTHKSDTDKTSVKNLIKSGQMITIANIKVNNNLNIK